MPSWKHFGYSVENIITNAAVNGIAKLQCDCIVGCAFDTLPHVSDEVFHYCKLNPVTGASSPIIMVRAWQRSWK